ncbi:hypothetical protein [Capnocytophaga catalasegens]|uniref:Uncharacterized protein n=1 Tax=Capnocytophaga catalasegens TaxID=1004260 RepID=A0AAV5AWD5_9FLAO|nr:hypothetical protein [Capnocytophaga catalasegens]GIZ16375.1 hypothetical protein RCZ03_23750 [Capnocytophaga catalasegens]GJM51566.1 hypothetical protein RCZ15_25390 [Capnocytophaga catalasegens]GJM54304.1 hypothetical protein RCZ16_26200 [Capnocytophaga catalasegens]
MMSPILKQYIEAATNFRKSNASEESIHYLYDMLYDLEKKDKTSEEKRILVDIYTLLGFHLSAYELFNEVADSKNNKDISKLYTLESKAKSHKNTFILKDLRKLKKKKSVPEFSLSDFELSDDDNGNKSYVSKSVKALIFNKEVNNEDFDIFIYKTFDFAQNFERLKAYLHFLADAKSELIAFYNEKIAPFTNVTADANWYASLEVYAATVGVDIHGKLFAEIEMGDMIDQDHILNIEFSDKNISLLGIDG